MTDKNSAAVVLDQRNVADAVALTQLLTCDVSRES